MGFFIVRFDYVSTAKWRIGTTMLLVTWIYRF
jgi:hypothetical protein